MSRGKSDRGSRILAQSRLGGPMPWVIAIMIALTTIAAAAGLALTNLANAARAELSGGLTVQVVEANPSERDRQAELAVSLLINMPTVDSVRRVPDAELAELIEPWLGAASGGAAQVPVPALIDVRLKGRATKQRVETLRRLLAGQAPAARIDAQSGWLAPVFGAISSLQWLALGLIVLLAGTSAAAVWLAARSALGSNRETIEIVHLLGGTDAQIANIFQRSIGIDAVMGGAAGLALGLGAILLLGRQFAQLGSDMIAGGGLGLIDWALIVGIPIAGALIAMLTARITVILALRKML